MSTQWPLVECVAESNGMTVDALVLTMGIDPDMLEGALRRCLPLDLDPDWMEKLSQVMSDSEGAQRRPMCSCHQRQVTQEIEGRVLVCDECAADPTLREHARRDWR